MNKLVIVALCATLANGSILSSSILVTSTTTVSSLTKSLPCYPGRALPGRYTKVFDMVALPNSALQTGLSRDDGYRLFAKSGLLFRGDERFELRIAETMRSRAAMGFGSSPVPTRAVQNGPCRESTHGWKGVPGGFWTDEPRCLVLSVSSGGRTKNVQIGLGTPCPGQRGPFGQSER